MMGWGWGAGVAGWMGMLLMVVFWAAVIGVAVWGIGRATRSTIAPLSESPRAILDRRFASGQIDAEAYAQARRILDGQAPAAPSR